MKSLFILAVAAVTALVLAVAAPWSSGQDKAEAQTPPVTRPYATIALDGPTASRVATLLGLKLPELAAKLSSGQTLEALAEAARMSSAAVVAVILDPYRASLDLRVRYGYLTQQESDLYFSSQQSRVAVAVATPLGVSMAGVGDGRGPYSGELHDECPMHQGGGSGMMGEGMMGYGYQDDMMGRSYRGGMMGGGYQGGGYWDGMMGQGYRGGGMMGGGMMGGGYWGGMMGGAPRW